MLASFPNTRPRKSRVLSANGARRTISRLEHKAAKKRLAMDAAPVYYEIFRTSLGYMGTVGQSGALLHLLFNYSDRPSIEAKLLPMVPPQAQQSSWYPDLADRLRRYAEGLAVDFSDIPVKLSHTTPFAQRVMDLVREIPYGQQMTYGQLAEAAGNPGAARAVGSVMRKNPVPLVVPCHRVVRNGGTIGAYSAPGGGDTKRRLLAMESRRDIR
jgi:methylated-DNA-[protein]-cysteine S-methyltransferase